MKSLRFRVASRAPPEAGSPCGKPLSGDYLAPGKLLGDPLGRSEAAPAPEFFGEGICAQGARKRPSQAARGRDGLVSSMRWADPMRAAGAVRWDPDGWMPLLGEVMKASRMRRAAVFPNRTEKLRIWHCQAPAADARIRIREKVGALVWASVEKTSRAPTRVFLFFRLLSLGYDESGGPLPPSEELDVLPVAGERRKVGFAGIRAPVRAGRRHEIGSALGALRRALGD